MEVIELVKLSARIRSATVAKLRLLITRRLMALLVAACLCLVAVAQTAHASGIATHWYVGDLILTKAQRERPDLGAFLAIYYDMFRRGTTYPDASLKYFHTKYGEKWGPADQATHERQKVDPGLVTAFLNNIRTACAPDFAKGKNMSEQCASAFAFLLGMVNHMIADALWHGTWIAATTAPLCPNIPESGIGAAPLPPNTLSRHALSDQDIDICLASRLTGNPSALTVSLEQETATRTKDSLQLLCPEGQFFDAINAGTCWSCPPDYGRYASSAVNTNNACIKGAHEDFRGATRHSRATGTVGTDCPKGQFVHLGLYGSYGYCYSCPSGYNRTASRIDQDRACSKGVAADFKPAASHGRVSLLCPSGQFAAPTANDPATWACFACPANAPTHYDQYSVNDSRVCQKVEPVPCDKITGVSFDPGRYVRLLADMRSPISIQRRTYVWRYLRPAYNTVFKDIYTGIDVDAAGIDKQMDDFISAAMAEPLLSLSDIYLDPRMTQMGFTHAASKCTAAFEQVNNPSQKGSMPDLAETAKKFIFAIWDAILVGKMIHFNRTGSFDYNATVDGKVVACTGSSCR